MRTEFSSVSTSNLRFQPDKKYQHEYHYRAHQRQGHHYADSPDIRHISEQPWRQHRADYSEGKNPIEEPWVIVSETVPDLFGYKRVDGCEPCPDHQDPDHGAELVVGGQQQNAAKHGRGGAGHQNAAVRNPAQDGER